MVKCSGDGDISEYRNVDDNDYCDEDDGIHDDDKDEVDDSNDYDQVGKVTALAFLLNGSETELFLCEEGAVKITLARFCNICHHDH